MAQFRLHLAILNLQMNCQSRRERESGEWRDMPDWLQQFSVGVAAEGRKEGRSCIFISTATHRLVGCPLCMFCLISQQLLTLNLLADSVWSKMGFFLREKPNRFFSEVPWGRWANANFSSANCRTSPATRRLKALSTTCKNWRKQQGDKGRGEAGCRLARGQAAWPWGSRPNFELCNQIRQHKHWSL